MANRPAPALGLREGDREELARITRSTSVRAGLAQRARIVLAAADGEANERIAAREEAFLEDRFGKAFREWADQVPAMLPLVTRYRRADVPFGWRRPLGSEFHGLMTIASVVLVLDLFRSWLATGRRCSVSIWGSGTRRWRPRGGSTGCSHGGPRRSSSRPTQSWWRR